jgi:hypothetical protein
MPSEDYDIFDVDDIPELVESINMKERKLRESELRCVHLTNQRDAYKRKCEAMHAKVADYADQIRYNVAHKYTTNAPQMMSMEDVWHMLQRIEEAGR